MSGMHQKKGRAKKSKEKPLQEKGFFSKNKYLIAGFLVVLVYLLPFLALGENAPALAHDTTDSTLVWYITLAKSGQLFGPLDAVIPQVMDGLPRSSLPEELNFVTLSFFSLPAYAAYALNIGIMHIVAFFGMYLLLKKHFLKEKSNEIIAIGVSLCFALLPFWPLGGLTIAGLPLALFSFLNIRAKNATKTDWVATAILPFFCLFTYSFVFFLFGMFLLWAYDFWKQKKANLLFLAAILLMSGIFLIVEYRLVYSMLLSQDFISHRTEFARYPTDFLRVLGRSARVFLFGQYHAASLHYFVLAAAAIAGTVLLFGKKAKKISAVFKEPRVMLAAKLLLLIAAICVFSETIVGWDALEPLRQQFSILTTFSFDRFIFLLPLLWYIVFALALCIIAEKAKYGKQIAIALILLQAGFLFAYTDGTVQAGGLGEMLSTEPSFAGIYSTSLFSEINDFIGQRQQGYRIVSIGLPANIPQYSGFYTLDSYQDNYLLQYKRDFRRIIEKELDKSAPVKQYFDEWGSRCYVFAAELEGKYFLTKETTAKISGLELNTNVLKEMGGKYVFSAVEIENSEANGLQLMKVFERQDAIWKIWLYEVQ